MGKFCVVGHVNFRQNNFFSKNFLLVKPADFRKSNPFSKSFLLPKLVNICFNYFVLLFHLSHSLSHCLFSFVSFLIFFVQPFDFYLLSQNFSCILKLDKLLPMLKVIVNSSLRGKRLPVLPDQACLAHRLASRTFCFGFCVHHFFKILFIKFELFYGLQKFA